MEMSYHWPLLCPGQGNNMTPLFSWGRKVFPRKQTNNKHTHPPPQPMKTQEGEHMGEVKKRMAVFRPCLEK